jgi:membrane-associated phospholipid phosphatase
LDGGWVKVGDVIGSPTYTVSFSLATWGVGAVFGAPKVRETGLMLFEHMIIVGLIQQPLRVIVGRARPRTGEGNTSFDPFTKDDAYASFISGHAWSTFGIATILSHQINRTWASVGLYALAMTTPLSRMHDDKHWLTDVLVGSALGYYSAHTIWSWHKKGPGSAYRLAVVPNANGLSLALRF